MILPACCSHVPLLLPGNGCMRAPGRSHLVPHAEHEKGRGSSEPRPPRAIRLLQDVPCRLFGLCGAAAGSSGALALFPAGGLAAAARLALRGLFDGPFDFLAYAGHTLCRSFPVAFTLFLFLPGDAKRQTRPRTGAAARGRSTGRAHTSAGGWQVRRQPATAGSSASPVSTARRWRPKASAARMASSTVCG